MGRFLPIVRMVVYDTDDTTVLTPAPGAQHSDAFQLEDRANPSTGYKPYLLPPAINWGTLDLLDKVISQGSATIKLWDEKLGRSNLIRWVTAFFGDSAGKSRAPGHLVKFTISYDNGATFGAWFTGRITAVNTASQNWVGISIRDLSRELDRDIFVGLPHSSITYAFPAPLMPNGFVASVGTYANLPTISETPMQVQSAEGSAVNSFSLSMQLTATDAQKILSNGFRSVLGEPIVNRLISSEQTFQVAPAVGGFVNPFHLWIDTGSATGRLELQTVRAKAQGDQWVIFELIVNELLDSDGAADTGNADYIAKPADLTNVTAYIVNDQPRSKNVRLYINDVHQWQLFKDLLDGKFSRLTAAGAVRYITPHDSAAFASFIADTTWPDVRFIVEESPKLNDFAEAELMKPHHGSYRINGAGEVTPLDLRLPSSLSGLTTISDTDRVEGERPSWSHTDATVVTGIDVTVFRDIPVTEDGSPNRVATFALGPIPLYRNFDLEATLGENRISIEPKGWRTVDGEKFNGQAREEYLIKGLGIDYTREVRPTFARGAPTAEVTLVRTQALDGLNIGDACLQQLNGLIDPSTWKRGGTRLARVVGKSVDGRHRMRLRLVDLGANLTPAAPTLGTMAQETGNTRHGVKIPISALNAAADAVLLQIAITDTATGTRPVEASSLWVTVGIYTAAADVFVRRLGANVRVWARARSQPVESKLPQLPGNWVFPGGTGRVDTATIPAPSAVTVTPATILTSSTVQESWTAGSTAYQTIVGLEQPASTDTDVDTLAAGQTTRTLNDYLTANTTYTSAYAYHRDSAGGISAKGRSGSFTTPVGFQGPTWATPSIAFG